MSNKAVITNDVPVTATAKEKDLAKKAIIRARISLLHKHPFFGSLALNMVPIEDTIFTRTLSVDPRGRMRYSANYVLSLKPEELESAIAHEVLHLADRHSERCGARIPVLFNIAGDYAINLILKDSNMKLSPDWLLDEDFRGLSSEAIYEKIYKEIEKLCKENGVGHGSCGSAADGSEKGKHPSGETGEIEGVDPSSWPIHVANAANIARKKGKLPAALERYIDEKLNPKLDWKQILARLLRVSISARSGRDDYSYSRPSRRTASLREVWKDHKPPILASTVSQDPGEILIAIDSSGSIGGDEIHRFVSEASAIVEMVGRPVRFVYCDAEIQSEGLAQDYKEIVRKAKGGGGTSFIPIFEYAERMRSYPCAIIVFTDLYGTFPPNTPKGSTIWCVPHVNDIDIPFGKRVNVTLGKNDC